MVLGIGDDAALLQVPAGMQLVVATDTLNAGVHFPIDTAPADIGWKALAVNLSDLAAMAAEPAWCTLSLSLPGSDVAWLDGFLDGFLELAAQHGVALVGGDTTRGPLSISVTVHGFVSPGRALRRDGRASATTSGSAARSAMPRRRWSNGAAEVAAAMHAAQRGSIGRRRASRWVVRWSGIAHAGIDLSDGLLADLGHVCRASGVAPEIDLDSLPASRCAAGSRSNGERADACCRWPVATTTSCASPRRRRSLDEIQRRAAQAGIEVSWIGRIVAGEGVRLFDGDGERWQPPRSGYEHFA